jgi:hypothetical protein
VVILFNDRCNLEQTLDVGICRLTVGQNDFNLSSAVQRSYRRNELVILQGILLLRCIIMETVIFSQKEQKVIFYDWQSIDQHHINNILRCREFPKNFI